MRNETSDASSREVEELIVHSNILKNLNIGQCVLLRHFPTNIDLINMKYIDPNVLDQNIKTKEVMQKYLNNYEVISKRSYNELR